ncbi:hypothetical protein [Chitinophaga sp.]|uniref:hypothetical protein n=1 Tax=Chitinophaga sp. TaxID=1869181 RepID=UPI002F951AB4
MAPIYTTERFRIPDFFRIMCWVMSVIMLIMAGFTFSQINISPVLLFVGVAFLFLAWSMFAYARLELIMTDTSIVFKRGWNPHDIDWKTITKVDMAEVGKYDDPQTTIYYLDRKLKIAHSMFLRRQYKEILSLLEMKLPPELFTAQYQQLREKLAKR